LDHDAEVGVGFSEAAEINKVGYRRAHGFSMLRAVRGASVLRDSDLLVVDGSYGVPEYTLKQLVVPKADRDYFVVAAASVMAKIIRDDHMLQMASKYPEYGFDAHVGYVTPLHQGALIKYGLCPEHRLIPCRTVLTKAGIEFPHLRG
jgi:ribonuclease HII